MKRRELLQHLRRNGCEMLREGGRHSVFWNPSNGRTSAIPVPEARQLLMGRQLSVGEGLEVSNELLVRVGDASPSRVVGVGLCLARLLFPCQNQAWSASTTRNSDLPFSRVSTKVTGSPLSSRVRTSFGRVSTSRCRSCISITNQITYATTCGRERKVAAAHLHETVAIPIA